MRLKGTVNSPFPMLLIFECYVDGGFKKRIPDIQAATKADIAVLYDIIAYLNPPTLLNLTLPQFFTLQRLQIDSQCCIIVKV